MPLSPPPFPSVYLLALSDALLPLFFPCFLRPLPPSCRRGIRRRSAERFPKCLPITAAFIICISSFSFVGGRRSWAPSRRRRSSPLSLVFTRHVDARRSAYLLLTSPPASQRHTVPPQHISYLLSTRCLKIQTPLNFCQCLHVLSVGRGVKRFARVRSFHCSALSFFYASLQGFVFFFTFFFH